MHITFLLWNKKATVTVMMGKWKTYLLSLEEIYLAYIRSINYRLIFRQLYGHINSTMGQSKKLKSTTQQKTSKQSLKSKNNNKSVCMQKKKKFLCYSVLKKLLT
jgi:hypothetical protein